MGGTSLLLYFPVVRRLPVIGLLLLFVTAAGCSEPPQKEIDQAQGAIEAARAAGADRYATAEFTAATSSLDKSRDAVDQRDYRQALNYAIDSRQRAVEASRLAVEGRTRAKHDAEAAYGEAATRANRLQAMLRTAETGGTPARLLKSGQASLRNARTTLQKASATITAGNFEEATGMLTEVRGKLDAAIAEAQKIPPTRRGR
jgi:hypothetical protein